VLRAPGYSVTEFAAFSTCSFKGVLLEFDWFGDVGGNGAPVLPFQTDREKGAQCEQSGQ
jgi:hypothetical protein